MTQDAYNTIGDMWREANVPHRHKMTEGEARKAKRYLWRKFANRTFKFHMTVRPVWMRDGWRRLAHDISHRIHEYKSPLGTHRPHAWNHPAWERAIVAEIIARGWHTGKLVSKPKTPKPKPPIVDVRRARALINLKKAETRLKRAETIAKKWRRVVKGYERRATLNGAAQTQSEATL